MKKTLEKEDVVIEETKKDKIVKFVKALIPYVIIFIVVMLIRTFIITPIVVSGPSMQPTLDGGELMILKKTKNFDRFDIVVVDIGNEDIIKRIIAMPGESISCEKGIIYINGRKQEEKYGSGITFDFDKVVLSNDEYFVMGDNRQDSKDSRHIGPVKMDSIKGTTNLVLFPFSNFGTIK